MSKHVLVLALLLLLVMVAFTFGYSAQAQDGSPSSVPEQLLPVDGRQATTPITLDEVALPDALRTPARPPSRATEVPAPQRTNPPAPRPAAPAPTPSFDSIG